MSHYLHFKYSTASLVTDYLIDSVSLNYIVNIGKCIEHMLSSYMYIYLIQNIFIQKIYINVKYLCSYVLNVIVLIKQAYYYHKNIRIRELKQVLVVSVTLQYIMLEFIWLQRPRLQRFNLLLKDVAIIGIFDESITIEINSIIVKVYQNKLTNE